MNPQPTIDAESVLAFGSSLVQAMSIEIVDETGSTNSDLLARCAVLRVPTVLLAEHQTAGRGRSGRSWLSEPGSSLTFSVALPFRQPPQALLGLPLVIGVALAEALRSLDVIVELKWPNDVLKGGKKLAGVLVETAVHGDVTWAVVGVGLNLIMPTELEQQIGQPVADATWLAGMDRNRLMAVLLNHLAGNLHEFGKSGFTSFVQSWNDLHAYSGKRMNLIDHGKTVLQGIALGVNHQGCLLLRDDHGVVHSVVAGDVSLRIE